MNQIVVNADLGKATISRHIYGHFAEHLGRCIYGGFWVGEDSPIPNTRGIRNDVVEALRAVKIPNLRWPGGCFADEYHWMDGIGPREQRVPQINSHWGGLVESNHFGTHEFMDLCAQLECEPYICGNVGSGTVHEMQQWVEYLTADDGPMAELRRANGREEPWQITYWGVGNENWGCGGNMRPEFYADEYRRFQTYSRNYGANKLYKIACGPRNDDYHWTEVMMLCGRGPRRNFLMHGLSLHYYTPDAPFRMQHTATQFGEREWFEILTAALVMEELVVKHSTIMDRYDPEKTVGLVVDEWGSWYAPEQGTNPRFLYQQNSLRDALIAAISLNIFNTYCDRISMTNIAQTVNVLQALILTEENSDRIVLTPTCHVFELYKVHQDATLLPLDLRCMDYMQGERRLPTLSASASRDQAGKIHVTVANLNPNESADLECVLRGAALQGVRGRVLTASEMTAYNTFDRPDVVRPVTFDAVKVTGDRLQATLPAMSVVALEIDAA